MVHIMRSQHQKNVGTSYHRCLSIIIHSIVDMVPKKDDLEALTQNPGESFSAYVGRWRTMAFQVKNKPPEDEQMDMIIRSANPAIY